uniref:Uncharacterized protein n=1 Tax=Cyanothece sp. (strain PCC 7425 / ATCC 29141) TaxID=395961 RepID=B8HYR4_CYAP4
MNPTETSFGQSEELSKETSLEEEMGLEIGELHRIAGGTRSPMTAVVVKSQCIGNLTNG